MREAPASDVVLAGGFSCRTHIQPGESGGRTAMHLAELLRAGLHHDDGLDVPEHRWADRPDSPSAPVRAAVLAALMVAVPAALTGAGVAARRKVGR